MLHKKSFCNLLIPIIIMMKFELMILTKSAQVSYFVTTVDLIFLRKSFGKEFQKYSVFHVQQSTGTKNGVYSWWFKDKFVFGFSDEKKKFTKPHKTITLDQIIILFWTLLNLYQESESRIFISLQPIAVNSIHLNYEFC